MQKYKVLLEAAYEFEGLLSLAYHRNALSETLKEMINVKGDRLVRLINESLMTSQVSPAVPEEKEVTQVIAVATPNIDFGKKEETPEVLEVELVDVEEEITQVITEEVAEVPAADASVNADIKDETNEATEVKDEIREENKVAEIKEEPRKEEPRKEESKTEPEPNAVEEKEVEEKEKKKDSEKGEGDIPLSDKLERIGVIGVPFSRKERKPEPAIEKQPAKEPEPVKKVSFSQDSFESYVIEDDDEEEIVVKRPPRKKVAKRAKEKKKPVFSLNDRFLFIRELFGGDASKFNMVVERIGAYDNFNDVKDYLMREYDLDPEKETDERFFKIIEETYR